MAAVGLASGGLSPPTASAAAAIDAVEGQARGELRSHGGPARLKYLIELRGKSVAQVGKELGRSRGFLGDALRGGKRLPLETILEVLDLLQVDPARFFAGATADERRCGAYGSNRPRGAEVADGKADDPLRQIRNNLGDGSIEVEEVARALRAVIRLLDEKGYLSREELGSALSSRGDSGKRS